MMPVQTRHPKSGKQIDSKIKNVNTTETTDFDSASSPVSGTSPSSSDESKSEIEIKKEKKKKSSKRSVLPAGIFHIELWVTLTVVFIVLDIGKHVVRIYFPSDWLPFGKIHTADFMQISYCITVPFCLLKLWEKSPRRSTSTIIYIIVILNTVGSSISMISDCVTERLVSIGYDTNLPLGQNAAMKKIEPQKILTVLRLLSSFEKDIGQPLWQLTLFLIFFFYFMGCFIKRKHRIPEGIQQLSRQSWFVLPFFSLYMWYLIAEYQMLTSFLVLTFFMLFYQLFEQSQHRITDINGQFLLQSMGIAMVFLLSWKWLLWGDSALHEKYPGFTGIPQPLTWWNNMYSKNLVPSMDGIDELVEKISSPILTVTVPGAPQ
ncbi:ceroid-lipofuscinosis neuronal protein 6 homolog [Saccoglossus kowalevskii]|uniref:Ceroid-lipofuscinosis neuronal protein 6 homolog n=1 Tax=Saccoglossus kowalevskii TaxID=10224 RepID=A0ABM0GT74_SACKO|nr:PREDICTED: ceroid-lipofuscinosis neuronal protein 6 homolog [Saccoglossus kowalevskii]